MNTESISPSITTKSKLMVALKRFQKVCYRQWLLFQLVAVTWRNKMKINAAVCCLHQCSISAQSNKGRTEYAGKKRFRTSNYWVTYVLCTYKLCQALDVLLCSFNSTWVSNPAYKSRPHFNFNMKEKKREKKRYLPLLLLPLHFY